MRVLVVYDGTLQSKDALRYGLREARERRGDLIVLQVFDNCAFFDYGAGPRAIERARLESLRYAEEARTLIDEEGCGVRTRVHTEEGDPEEEVIRFASERWIDLLLCPPRYRSIAKRFAELKRDRARTESRDMVPEKIAVYPVFATEQVV